MKLIDKLIRKKEKTINQEEFPIRLSENEQKFFIDNIKNAKSYLEFGSGGSTFVSLKQTNIPKIISVESDINWIEHLRNWDTIKQNENGRLSFIHVNIGKTGMWGVPVELDKKELFPNYSTCAFSNNEKYDAVFIDGRFRVACALQSVLNSSSDAKILMHDYNVRPEYHCVLEFLDIVDIIDSMALFKIKENIDNSKLLEIYEEYKYNID